MTNNPFSLSERTVLITGAAGGIGTALVRGFREAGANVVATDMNKDALEQALASEKEDERVLLLPMDVTREDHIVEAIERAASKFGRFDVLVNNAGIKSAEPLLSGDPAKIDRTMRINTDAVLKCSRLAATYFMGRGGGRIINVGSSLSSQGAVFNYQAGGADYCLSKAVVHDITKLLAFEGAKHGINVNGIAPGIIDTPMHGRPREETEARHGGRIPLGRVGNPGDLAGLAVFLAGAGAEYITGQIIHVNGGMLMHG